MSHLRKQDPRSAATKEKIINAKQESGLKHFGKIQKQEKPNNGK